MLLCMEGKVQGLEMSSAVFMSSSEKGKGKLKRNGTEGSQNRCLAGKCRVFFLLSGEKCQRRLRDKIISNNVK